MSKTKVEVIFNKEEGGFNIVYYVNRKFAKEFINKIYIDPEYAKSCAREKGYKVMEEKPYTVVFNTGYFNIYTKDINKYKKEFKLGKILFIFNGHSKEI